MLNNYLRDRHYCTLFDSKYLPQGLAMYESLIEHSSRFMKLFILPMDAECERILIELDLPCVEVIQPADFGKRMGVPRHDRTWQEYCWSCASNLAAYCLHLDIGEITYLDADMMFFSDPDRIFYEIDECSIAVIPHRLIPAKKHLEVNGQFNVCWVTFANNAVGQKAADLWALQCRTRCSADVGCGDQVYLDEWPMLYGRHLCVIQHDGAGLAPWNIGNYRVGIDSLGIPVVTQDEDSRYWSPAVFYHYHEYIHGVRLTNYELRHEDIEAFYKPYIAAVDKQLERLGAMAAR